VEVLANAGLMALASLLVCVLPLPMGIVYAVWPTEQRLTLIRTLSLAAVFAALAGVFLGFINVLRGLFERPAADSLSGAVAVGLAESLVPLVLGFGCLTATWLCVTVGLWRRP
jgi:hypothetical protein